MARIRSIKPEFWGDLKMARLSRDARLLYIALWNQCDEHARMHGDPRFVKGHCLPYDDDLGLGDIDRLLSELAAAGRIVRYLADEAPFLYLPKLAEHQRLEAAKVPSRLPSPPDPVGADPHPDDTSSAPRADESAPRADKPGTTVALHVAGGMEHVAGSRGSVAAAPRADPGHLIGEFLDLCLERPPEQFIKRLGRDVKVILDTGTSADAVRGGLAIVAERGLQPSALAGAVHEHLNRRSSPRGSTTDQRVADGLNLAAQLKAEGR